MRKYLKYKQEVDKTFVRPLVAAVIMGTVAFGVYEGSSYLLEMVLVSDYFINLIALGAAVAIGALLYFVIIIRIKAVKEKELQNLPKGRTLVKIARKLHLL